MITEVRLFDLLKAKIGQKEAEAFIEIMDIKIEKKFEEKTKMLSTKEDLFLTKEELSGKMANLELKLTEFKADLIKWMIGNTIAVVTIMAVLFNLFLKK